MQIAQKYAIVKWLYRIRKRSDWHEQYIIEMLHITKEFPGIIANDDITLRLRKGEIHALLGENGAGKIDPDERALRRISRKKGEIRKTGRLCRFATPTTRTH